VDNCSHLWIWIERTLGKYGYQAAKDCMMEFLGSHPLSPFGEQFLICPIRGTLTYSRHMVDSEEMFVE
jgi:hypothetical protein